MRFSEAINPKKYPKGVMSIPDTEFEIIISNWAHEMGRRIGGYRKQTRMEHWQEGIDSIYTALEEELQTVDTKTIQSHRKWEIMMLAAKTYFPEHIGLYHPTLVEQQRTRQLVANSQITRHLRNKAELLKFLKEDKDLGVKTISDLAVSRLQCEVLATSAEILVNQYKGGINNVPGLTSGSSVSAGTKTDADGGKNGGSASAKASASATVGAGYNSGMVDLGHGWKNRLSASVTASASADAYANASAKLDDLSHSASAGLGADTKVSANIDYVAEHSCKVSVGYLRRLLGPQFKTIEARLGGSAAASVGGSAKASAKAFSGGSFGHFSDKPMSQNKTTYNQSGLSDSDAALQKAKNTNVFSIADAGAGAEVEIAVRLQGNIGCTVAQSLDIDVSGDIFAGAGASGNCKFLINEQEVGMDIGARAMAGFEVGTSQTFSLKHPSRNVSIFSVKFRESLTAGAGVEGKVSARASLDQCYFDTTAGATVGVGSSIGCSSVISPRGVLLVGYDLLAVPTVLAIGSYMAKHNSGPHTQRMTRLCEFLNKQASKGEINQVYLDNMSRINASLSAMNADAERIYKTDCRTAGFQGFSEMSKADMASGVEGTSQSKYHSYTTDTLKTKPLVRVFGSEAGGGDAGISGPLNVGSGMRGESVSGEFIISQAQVQGAKVAGAISADKQELNRVVRAYEQAKTGGTGECVAYKVLRQDMLEGSKISYS
ncbi:hypothetical protein M3P05_16140 [Sansalvadorimonas sp. 2012CJ34-2]|uniref:Uncharacterized protein n=1 Tax=Parendozoicomonas callyspongiae TaxID=2942213 RepID=A0ABT0PJ86_9GAMM|nr:hypothetical protein [Sansalvadorimonas sp. 2012CJ34-2]MCL6271452.1 hypothetical protein [Sansalvadorimonas sp. 2012CJ34-2]